ncbi:hypothetical protein PSm6_49110 [Pseudomonas solani]|uniref:Uncharacterized protein n=1 Tax=Pseudomonas solani TaxID=2731552 RepID=A0ABM7LFW2_9PSED|nr:hypothetical protein PSm6_49110 [Pseudomonas solani]
MKVVGRSWRCPALGGALAGAVRQPKGRCQLNELGAGKFTGRCVLGGPDARIQRRILRLLISVLPSACWARLMGRTRGSAVTRLRMSRVL